MGFIMDIWEVINWILVCDADYFSNILGFARKDRCVNNPKTVKYEIDLLNLQVTEKKTIENFPRYVHKTSELPTSNPKKSPITRQSLVLSAAQIIPVKWRNLHRESWLIKHEIENMLAIPASFGPCNLHNVFVAISRPHAVTNIWMNFNSQHDEFQHNLTDIICS